MEMGRVGVMAEMEQEQTAAARVEVAMETEQGQAATVQAGEERVGVTVEMAQVEVAKERVGVAMEQGQTAVVQKWPQQYEESLKPAQPKSCLHRQYYWHSESVDICKDRHKYYGQSGTGYRPIEPYKWSID
jgi:hypothetical protein